MVAEGVARRQRPEQDGGGHNAAALQDDELAETRRAITTVLPDLRAFARFLIRDRTAADDLVQDAIVRALAALPQFQPGTNLKAWLFTIQRNLFFEQARRRRRETVALNAHAPMIEAVRGGQSTFADISDLETMLWRLPPLLREALVLVGAQELTHEEAALICDVPIGTMKARVSRARNQLTLIMADLSASG